MSLYRSSSGREVSHASNSSIDTFRFCRRKFQLSKILGWRPKGRKASLEFGKAVESAIQYFYDNDCKPGDAVDEFKRIWLKFAEIEMIYTAQEGNWKELFSMGSEHMKLFEVIYKDLPIRNPKWQLEYEKPLWPGTNLGDLTFQGRIDILTTASDGKRVIVDCKTAKSSLDVTSGMLSMDGQLRKYAWVSGIREVGFLNFVKTKTESFKHGDKVTLLADYGEWKSGTELIVVGTIKGEDDVVQHLNLGTSETVRIMDEELDQISGKGSKERKEQVFQKYALANEICTVSRDSLTKVKIQYLQATIPEEEMADIGDGIGTDVYAMKQASVTGKYPQDGGVRFPNQKCTWCEMNPICLKMGPDKIAETLVQISPVSKEDDWLDELLAEAE
jgi:hypothetical protein